MTTRIDRLEKLGLAERRASPDDRRVKLVWLTPLGVKRRAVDMARLGQPPEQLAGLPLADLRTLARILAKLDLPA
ncbi:MAG TPA: MarR family transcriptional regulator [Pseudonocardia sp.]|uniref:MarR family winged helix-turn-helix transcriptional regulator n=1 Tax=Pseudonocardia sp. TaxID=60912 RepID=UPI002CF73F9D|nr:MarR family transcriptional regulator [Pseudonocardia sp.]HTF48414.1 MarR family transcriptional regulator [Pseudonocardia sp.]